MEQIKIVDDICKNIGFESIKDTKTQIATNNINNSTIDYINTKMNDIKKYFSVSRLNLKRLNYKITTKQQVMALFRNLLINTQIGFEIIRKSDKDYVRLKPINTLYMEYILHMNNFKSCIKKLELVSNFVESEIICNFYIDSCECDIIELNFNNDRIALTDSFTYDVEKKMFRINFFKQQIFLPRQLFPFFNINLKALNNKHYDFFVETINCDEIFSNSFFNKSNEYPVLYKNPELNGRLTNILLFRAGMVTNKYALNTFQQDKIIKISSDVEDEELEKYSTFSKAISSLMLKSIECSIKMPFKYDKHKQHSEFINECNKIYENALKEIEKLRNSLT